MSRSGFCVDIRKKRGEKKRTNVHEEGVKKAEKSGRGREKVSLFSFPISFVFDGPGLFVYSQSIFYVCLGFASI